MVILSTAHGTRNEMVLTTPTPEIFREMSEGNPLFRSRAFAQEQLKRNVDEGRSLEVAERWVEAKVRGGKTTAEVYGLVRDRDAAMLGHSHELVDPAEFPDPWFFGAWVRGGNSGAVVIDFDRAVRLQFRAIAQAAKAERDRRFAELDVDDLAFDREAFALAVRRAASLDELKRVWPEGVPR